MIYYIPSPVLYTHLSTYKFYQNVTLRVLFSVFKKTNKPFFFLSIFSSDISKLQRRINELKLLEKRERELEELVQQLHGNKYRFYLVTDMMYFKNKGEMNF